MVFFDTNVLLYLLSADEAKADAAERALGQGGCISVQVLNELTNVCRRKLDMPWSRLHALLWATSPASSWCPPSAAASPFTTV